MKFSDKKYICYLYFNSPSTISDKNISMPATFSLSKEEARLFRHKLEIIKIYKQLTGIGLKESKDYVEEHLIENVLPMILTRVEIYNIQNKKTDQWGIDLRLKLGFYFDGVDIIRNESINNLLNN